MISPMLAVIIISFLFIPLFVCLAVLAVRKMSRDKCRDD